MRFTRPLVLAGAMTLLLVVVPIAAASKMARKRRSPESARSPGKCTNVMENWRSAIAGVGEWNTAHRRPISQ